MNKTLIFATHNENKLKEIREMVPSGLEVLGLTDIGFHEEIVEDAPDLEGNARLKTLAVNRFKACNCFSDDTGLEVEALNGEPGVFSARYAGPQKSAEDNMDKLLAALADSNNRSAQFRTVIDLIWEGKHYQFEGIVKGEIVAEKMGEKGFGYDPIFQPEGFQKTFAQMDAHEKHQVSHRGRAMAKLMAFLQQKMA